MKQKYTIKVLYFEALICIVLAYTLLEYYYDL